MIKFSLLSKFSVTFIIVKLSTHIKYDLSLFVGKMDLANKDLIKVRVRIKIYSCAVDA